MNGMDQAHIVEENQVYRLDRVAFAYTGWQAAGHDMA